MKDARYEPGDGTTLAAPKVGCTSGMKIKTRFYFAFRSVCTTFAPN